MHSDLQTQVASSPTINDQCVVTNNSGQDVIVLDAFTSVTNVTSNSPLQGYLQTLRNLTPTPIANNNSGTVVLNDTYPSGSTTQTSYIYQLLISSPTGLFPIMNVGELLDFDSLAYPPITVTQQAAENMQLAYTFCQNIMAYPGSALATGFVSALNSAQQQNSPSDIATAVANYFNTTKQFGGLDLPSYVAMSTYIKAFAWVWGLDPSGNPGRTYWLYSQADAQNPHATGQGTITFSNTSTAPSVADPTDPNSGYTITYTSTSGASQNLNFSNGAVVNDLQVDIPTICLQGNFALKSTYTQNPNDNVLWPVLVGSVNGTQMIGISQEPTDAFQNWLSSITPKTVGDVFNDFLKIMNAWMAIDFIKTKLQGKNAELQNDQGNANRGRPANQQQQAQADANANEVQSNARAANQEQANRLGNGGDGQPRVQLPVAQDVPVAQASANADQVNVENGRAGDSYQGAINEVRAQLQDAAQMGRNPQLEAASTSALQAEIDLPSAVQSGDFSSIANNLQNATNNITSAVQNSNLSEGVRQQIAESQGAQQAYEESSERSQENARNTSKGEQEFDSEEVVK